MSKDFCTSRRNDGKWVVKDDSDRITSSHSSQDEAWKETRRLARGAGSEAILHGKDGKILTQNCYGHDPHLNDIQ